MKITINDNPVEHSLAITTPLGEALNVIQQVMVSEEDIITSIFIDGAQLKPGTLTEWKNRTLEEFAHINIEVMGRALFASSGLRIMASQLEASDTLRHQIVDQVAQGYGQKAMQRLSEYLRLWDTAQQTLASGCRLMNIDLDRLEQDPVAGVPGHLPAAIGRLSGQLEQIKLALEAGDTVLLGDILDYEFGEITREWCDLLNQLSDLLDPSRSNAEGFN